MNLVPVQGDRQQDGPEDQDGAEEEGAAASPQAASSKTGKCQGKKRKRGQLEPQDPEVPRKASKAGADSPRGQAARRRARLPSMRRALTLHGRAPRLCAGPSSQLCRLRGACGASVRAQRPVVTSHALDGVTSFQASLWPPPSPFWERRTRAARSGLTPLLPSRVPVGRHLRSGSRSLIPFPERWQCQDSVSALKAWLSPRSCCRRRLLSEAPVAFEGSPQGSGRSLTCASLYGTVGSP